MPHRRDEEGQDISGLVIYALPVGGGTLAICALPGVLGSYADDLDLIGSWRPGLVVSMTTEVEMIQSGARVFGTDIQGRASRWAHLPVDDFSVPDSEVNEKWDEVSRSARQALAGGGRVLIHCRGGCGRSGMAALRLMVECGEKGPDALTRLRAVRPCAVETDEQMAWALAGKKRRQGQ